jgi:hypothetical protein
VSSILQDMSLLLVPSVLHEAFGMVVLDAMLHGLPVLVAAAGALSEAAAGAAAAVVPVPLVEFPPLAAGNSQVCLQQGCACSAAATGAINAGQLQHAAVLASCPGGGCSQGCDHCNGRNAAAAAGMEACAGHSVAKRHADDCCAACVGAWLLGQRRWGDRVYPPLQQQHADSWADAVLTVLGSRETYMQASARSKAAAQEVLLQGPGQLKELLLWLQQLTAAVPPQLSSLSTGCPH